MMTVPFSQLLESTRLVMRPLMKSDAKDLHQAILGSLSTLKLWMDWAEEPYSQEDAEERILRHSYQNSLPEGSRAYGIYLKDNQSLIGEISVHHRDLQKGSAQLGYWMSCLYQGQGLMREAVIVITDYLFQHHSQQELEIYCERGNDRSMAIPRTLGFHQKIILPSYTINLSTQKPNDVFVFSRTGIKDLPLVSWRSLA